MRTLPEDYRWCERIQRAVHHWQASLSFFCNVSSVPFRVVIVLLCCLYYTASTSRVTALFCFRVYSTSCNVPLFLLLRCLYYTALPNR